MDWGALIVSVVPWIIPAFLIGSWLVNTKTPGNKSSGDNETKPKSKPPAKEKSGDKALSDKDMTSS